MNEKHKLSIHFDIADPSGDTAARVYYENGKLSRIEVCCDEDTWQDLSICIPFKESSMIKQLPTRKL